MPRSPADAAARWAQTCPLCGQSLASSSAVLFREGLLCHARCWPGDAAPLRICAKCATPLERYEPAAFEGRTAYHLTCWAGKSAAAEPPLESLPDDGAEGAG